MSAGSSGGEPEALERQGASPSLLAATLTLSVFAAWAVPGNRLGLGAVLVGAGLAALVTWARSTPLRPESLGYGALALALMSMTAVRSAEWVIGLDVVAASVLATLAVVGGGTWVEVVRGPLVGASRGVQAAPFLARGAGRLTAGWGLSPALRGIGIGLVLLVVFGALFVSADQAFAQLAQDLLVPDIDPALLPARAAVFVLVAVAATTLVTAGPRFAHLGEPSLLRATRAALFEPGEPRPRRGLAPVEWILALALLDFLFVAFVGVQVAVLFGGHDYVLQTAGLTYAEYARQGFFELLAAAALTLAVVAAASRWATRRGSRDARLLEILLGVLLLLTLVVLASALKRLVLYEEAFGFTRLRVTVHAVILWLAGTLVMVLAAGAFHRWRVLPRAVVSFSAAALLVFSLVNPDGLVAARNVERFGQTGRVDLAYLSGLSPDAVPSLSALPPTLRGCVLAPYMTELAEPDAWPAWNLGRARARGTIERTPPAHCSE